MFESGGGREIQERVDSSDELWNFPERTKKREERAENKNSLAESSHELLTWLGLCSGWECCQ